MKYLLIALITTQFALFALFARASNDLVTNLGNSPYNIDNSAYSMRNSQHNIDNSPYNASATNGVYDNTGNRIGLP
jgi:hypothetical protein